jgi:hypothetical protein
MFRKQPTRSGDVRTLPAKRVLVLTQSLVVAGQLFIDPRNGGGRPAREHTTNGRKGSKSDVAMNMELVQSRTQTVPS